MALKPCRECGELVSAAAKFCPRCGVPAPVIATGQDAVVQWSGVAVVLVICGLLMFWFASCVDRAVETIL